MFLSESQGIYDWTNTIQPFASKKKKDKKHVEYFDDGSLVGNSWWKSLEER